MVGPKPNQSITINPNIKPPEKHTTSFRRNDRRVNDRTDDAVRLPQRTRRSIVPSSSSRASLSRRHQSKSKSKSKSEIRNPKSEILPHYTRKETIHIQYALIYHTLVPKTLYTIPCIDFFSHTSVERTRVDVSRRRASRRACVATRLRGRS